MNAGLIVLLAIFATAYALPQKGDSIECTMCKTIVGMVEQYLEKNEDAEEEEIIQYVCKSLGPMESMCSMLVKSYLPQIIQYIEDDQPPTTVCGPSEARMCN
uniref:Saposin B-type domain-containing protein n=1 Tax=Plectus sambesii TaxID=2011161 RepID=A0A914V4G4_9BILA